MSTINGLMIKKRPVLKVDSVKHSFIETFPGTKILSAGNIQVEGHRALHCDILVEEDVKIPMRDGITLYADIYRPPNSKPGTVPAIIAAGPFGKSGGPNKANFNRWPWRHGCPRKATSGLEKFEGPDPGYWCYHGYAIVHTDCRGTWKSEGDVNMPCTQEGQDNYDIIEWLAEQPWCNGKLTMCGNSYLAMTQWFTGAENPPHLACLAPWEGISDLYNDIVGRGGIPNPGFIDGFFRDDFATLTGSKADDITSLIYENPTWNDYWENHRAKFENIHCPMYIVSSWTNLLHVSGTFRGWEKSVNSEKWLRIHDSHEWPDLYNAFSVEDLRKFYDYYMKEAKNDWIYTPKVRMCILNPGGKKIINRPETEFPLARQQPLKLYLDGKSNTLSKDAPKSPATLSYNATTGNVIFKMIVDTPFEFTGYIKLRVWAEVEGSNDMDIYAFLTKHDAETGKKLESVMVDVGYLADDPEKERQGLIAARKEGQGWTEAYFDDGPFGCLRASHRELDEKESDQFHPVYKHQKEDLLEPGMVTPLDIAFWPYGMVFNKGEELRLTVTGTHYKLHKRPDDIFPVLRNKGTHKFHTGGYHESYLLLPLIPTS